MCKCMTILNYGILSIRKGLYSKFLFVIALLIFSVFLFACDEGSDSSEPTETNFSIPSSYLFVQQAASGTFESLEGQGGIFLLTLNGVAPLTTWFTDRPIRKTGTKLIGEMLNNFLTGDVFPNAALEIPNEIPNGGGKSEVVVLTILGFDYDEGAATLKYEVSIITGDIAEVIPRYNSPNTNQEVTDALPVEITDDNFPSEFGPSFLFIDNLTGMEQESFVCEEPLQPIREVFQGDGYETFNHCCQISLPTGSCGAPPTCRNPGYCVDINGNPKGCGPKRLCPSTKDKCYMYDAVLWCCVESPVGG